MQEGSKEEEMMDAKEDTKKGKKKAKGTYSHDAVMAARMKVASK